MASFGTALTAVLGESDRCTLVLREQGRAGVEGRGVAICTLLPGEKECAALSLRYSASAHGGRSHAIEFVVEGRSAIDLCGSLSIGTHKHSCQVNSCSHPALVVHPAVVPVESGYAQANDEALLMGQHGREWELGTARALGIGELEEVMRLLVPPPPPPPPT